MGFPVPVARLSVARSRADVEDMFVRIVFLTVILILGSLHCCDDGGGRSYRAIREEIVVYDLPVFRFFREGSRFPGRGDARCAGGIVSRDGEMRGVLVECSSSWGNAELNSSFADERNICEEREEQVGAFGLVHLVGRFIPY